MVKNRHYMFIVPIIGVLLLLSLVGYRTYQNHEAQKVNQQGITIVTSLNMYGEIAKAVVGNAGTVTSILNKSTIDPHDFEPTAQTAKTYAQADLVVVNGGGYDVWATKLARANKQAKQINVGQLFNYQDGDNEHFWYRAEMVDRLTRELTQKLSQLEPKRAAYFAANANKYRAKMALVNAKRATVKQLLAGKTVMATEPVYDNALAGFDVKIANQAFARAVDEGNDPTPTAVRNWQSEIESGQVALVFENTQTTGKVVANALKIAREKQVPIVKVTETKPDHLTYVAWQLQILTAIEEALQK
ncbi:zinc ABC transporter substrate-binding protein [Weissella diestrammenae]|uniref:Zinc ABC transporter substrate-binding protein n=1 Tax=Weissella diestrammenae TaxID=1162633 RepID=A0A7G9T734_9LACO|nr:zinc ABC transporter substrate-binding protein [Weissella diestrammenae]MCM0582493.1 zinc ABC transporter substrate-binding protein [Weissella diestrammenae]QNN75909.1 zinc ABC transporter substrate-binding protein [Weissella diestrammenae]